MRGDSLARRGGFRKLFSRLPRPDIWALAFSEPGILAFATDFCLQQFEPLEHEDGANDRIECHRLSEIPFSSRKEAYPHAGD